MRLDGNAHPLMLEEAGSGEFAVGAELLLVGRIDFGIALTGQFAGARPLPRAGGSALLPEPGAGATPGIALRTGVPKG